MTATITKLLIKTITKLSDRLPQPSGVDGRVLTERAGVIGWESPDADTNDKVAATAADTTPGYLQGKLAAGAGIGLAIVDPGGNEKVQISSTAPTPTDELVKASATDTTPGTLSSKLKHGSNISLTIESPGGNEQLRIDASGGAGVDPFDQAELVLAVSTTGSDTPSGDRPARVYGGDYSAFPFRTIQAAINAIGFTRGPKTTINVGPGHFAPFDLTGKCIDSELWIIGTLGTPIGPFTVGTEVEAGWAYKVADAGWTPDEFKGMEVQILSGPGAGRYMTVFANSADTIEQCGSYGLEVGSVFQIMPFDTVIDGDGVGMNTTVYLHNLKGGPYILQNLDCVASGDQDDNILAVNCHAATLSFMNVRADGVGTGLHVDGAGCLLLEFCWFNGADYAASLEHVQSTCIDAYSRVDWIAPILWYHVGFAYDFEAAYCGRMIYLAGRFADHVEFNGCSYVNLQEARLEDGTVLSVKYCPTFYQEAVIGGAYCSYQYCGEINITQGRPGGLQFVRCGTIAIGNAVETPSLALTECCNCLLDNPTLSGGIQVLNGYLGGSFRYTSNDNVFDGSSFYTFASFNPGPATHYKTEKALTITLSSTSV